MKSTLAVSTALLGALAVSPASAQLGPDHRAPVEAQTQQAPATSMGRQYGAPAGNVLVTPANPAAAAARDGQSRAPGLNVNPDLLGSQAGEVADGYRVVDEPPMPRLNESGTAATSAKIGMEKLDEDEAALGERDGAIAPGIGDESRQIPGFDPAGDPAPPRAADGSLLLPPEPSR